MQDILRRMQALFELSDTECAHEEADELLLSTIRELQTRLTKKQGDSIRDTLEDIVSTYCKLEKWYA